MLRFIKELIIKILYLLILLYLIIFIPVFWGYKPLVVISGSMEPILKVGGILYYEDYKLEDFKKEDILVYKTKNHIISHRIVDIKSKGFITKGDANKNIDSHEVYNNQVMGKGTNFSIPYIGYYADYIYNHKYILFITVLFIVIEYIIDSHFKKKVGSNIEEIN